VRDVSNYNPNDQMRIGITAGTATLLRVPTSVHSSFTVGQKLWMSIAADGSLQVRGSDAKYYPASITMKGPDELHLTVGHNAAGNDQVWFRAGPSVDGEWVRRAPDDPTANGMRVRAEQDQAIVRYLPADAGRFLRIGSLIWRGIGAGGAMEVLVGGGRYDRATLRLQGSDTLWVEAAGDGGSQLWVRPPRAASPQDAAAGPLSPATAPPPRNHQVEIRATVTTTVLTLRTP
jgi:hypothetical protein